MLDDVIVLNEGLEMRTSKSGKMRCSVKVTAEPLIVNFDAKRLGRGPALAIAEHFRQRISDIAAIAAPATIKARKVAAKALELGKSWAVKRYAGGRTGAMTPNASDRLFNDSGRMAKTITATASEDAWRVNVAANRLSPDTADHGGIAAVEAIFAKLVDLVPEIGDASLLLDVLSVRRAIKASTDSLVKKIEARSSELPFEAIEAAIELASQIFETVDAIADAG